MKLHRCRSVAPLLCVALTFSLTGCTTFSAPLASTMFTNPFVKKVPTATAADPCVQIVCLWQHGEGNDPDGYPCKGFQGQILFLSSRGSTPVKIDGEVRIYLFDDHGTAEDQSKPMHTYNFDKGSWDIHFMESSFGPTYGVFVPYTRRGTTDANCSLRVRLKPNKGPVVFSDFSNMQLNPNKKETRGDDAKPMSKEDAERLATEALSQKLLRTTTIALEKEPKITQGRETAAKPASENPIQLASHEVPAVENNETAEAKRIRQLEQMVQQLKQLQQRPDTMNSNLNPASTAPATPPQRVLQRLDEQPDNRRSDSPSPRRLSLRKADEDNVAEPSANPNATPRRKHPLE